MRGREPQPPPEQNVTKVNGRDEQVKTKREDWGMAGWGGGAGEVKEHLKAKKKRKKGRGMGLWEGEQNNPQLFGPPPKFHQFRSIFKNVFIPH